MVLKQQLKLAVRIHRASVPNRSDRSVRSYRQTWTGPIGRSTLFWDRSEIGSVQGQSPVGPVQLHLKNSRSYALDRTGPRSNRGCASLPTFRPPISASVTRNFKFGRQTEPRYTVQNSIE